MEIKLMIMSTACTLLATRTPEPQQSTLLPATTKPPVAVVIHSLEGYGQHEAFARAAAAQFEQILNAPAFYESLAKLPLTETNGLDARGVYDKILQAQEQAGLGGTDGTIDLRLRTISTPPDRKIWMRRCRMGSRAGTIGVDGGGSGVAAVCPQRLQYWAERNQTQNLAAHFAHEYMHILGFSHHGKKATSVPYQVGNLVQKLGAQNTTP